MNLLKETMGKIGVLDPNGKVRYPIDVSYDMGWQKSAKTYGSLSGHGLMVGSHTKKMLSPTKTSPRPVTFSLATQER